VGRYLLRRLMVAFLTIVVVMAALALLSASTPGEPARAMLGPRATPQLIVQVRQAMHLDESVPQQVWIFMSGAAQGDLGTDYINGIPVWDLVRDSLLSTVLLAVTSLVLAIALGVPLGVLAAARPGSALDRVLGVFSVSLVSVPPFVVALLLLLLFSVRLGWLPASGDGSATEPVGYLEHLLMPAIALAVGWVGYLARLVRASMLEELSSPYIRTARAFGLRDRLILYRYALRNALIPVVAVLGIGLGTLFGGAVIVEFIFNRPGLGRLMLDAIGQRDYIVVRGGALVIALLFILSNLLADLAYRFLDPRIDLTQSGSK
jgi:peptide/nickel transport system permease protein